MLCEKYDNRYLAENKIMLYMHYTCTLGMQIFSEFYYKPFQIQKYTYFLSYIKAASYVIKILLRAGQFYKISANVRM